MSDVVNTALLIFAGLFPVVNPLGNAPVFLTMTRQCTDEGRHLLAWRVAVNGFLLLLGSLVTAQVPPHNAAYQAVLSRKNIFDVRKVAHSPPYRGVPSAEKEMIQCAREPCTSARMAP